MGVLNKPTIEGFIDKLIEDNHIKISSEVGKVQETLEKASKGMSNEEIFVLISTLNDRVDAPASNLITPHGLNYSGFESVVQEVSQKIVKEKEAREEKDNLSNESTNILLEPELSQEEIEALEREERIQGNIKSLGGFCADFLGLDNVEIPEKNERKIAEYMEKIKTVDKKRKELVEQGVDKETARKKAMEEEGITEEELKSSPEMKLAVNVVFNENVENISRKKKISKEEAAKVCLSEDSFVVGEVTKMLGENFNDVTTALETLRLNCLDSLQTMGVNLSEASLSSTRTGKSIDISVLKSKIEFREERRRKKRETEGKIKAITRRVKLNPEKESESKSLFNDLADEYIATGTTISDIYKKYQHKDEFEELEFEDVLEGVMDSLRANTVSFWGEGNVNALMQHERNCRNLDLLLDEYREAQDSVLTENRDEQLEEQNARKVERYIKKLEKEGESFQEIRTFLIKQRNVDPMDVKWQQVTMVMRGEEKEVLSSEQAIKNRNKVSNDRNQIIRISRENEITPEAAARQYFTENPDALQGYSKSERRILLGERTEDSEEMIKNNTLANLRTILKARNTKAMDRLMVDIVANNKAINQGYEDGYTPSALTHALKKAAKLNNRLKKLQMSNEKIESVENPKTASDIILEKERKSNQDAIFRQYVETGKTAAEIFQDIENQGNEYKFTFEEILGFIEEGAMKFLPPWELEFLKFNERNTYQDTLRINSHKTKIELMTEKSSVSPDDWVKSYNNKIAIYEGNIANNRKLSEDLKNKLAIRSGIVRDENATISVDQEPRGIDKIVDVTEVSSFNTSRTQNDGEQLESTVQGLEIAEIKTSKGIIPNVKAIAKNAKVTPASIKAAFSKIVRLKKEKNSITKENEAQQNENSKDASKAEDIVL